MLNRLNKIVVRQAEIQPGRRKFNQFYIVFTNQPCHFPRQHHFIFICEDNGFPHRQLKQRLSCKRIKNDIGGAQCRPFNLRKHLLNACKHIGNRTVLQRNPIGLAG